MINYLKHPVKQRIVKRIHFLLLLIFSPLLIVISAQNDTIHKKDKKQDSHKDNIILFGSDEILNVNLYLDLASFSKKPSKNDSFDGRISIHINETDSVNRDVTVKYRGISRYEICSFPPMQINFKNPLYSDSLKIKKLKLVTHCQANNINDEYVVREYLVYKLYNAFTDTSFRVRLLKVNYIDSKGNKKTIRKYGIFIEPVEILAKRSNAVPVKTASVNQSHIVPSVMDRLAIFMYMVSNWDWSIPGQHNVAVIKPLSYNPAGLGIAVPYDLDLTGVVNAEYAIPPPDLGIENVRQPIFTGICRTREVYLEDLKKFKEAKGKIYSVVNDFPHLSPRAKKDITSFLDQFFDQLEKQKSLDNLVDIFLNNCKK
jgi:hypothetical protein